MLKIEISNRHYNGDVGIKSILEEKYSFEIEETLCISNSNKTFYNNDNFGSNILSSVNVSIPFKLKEKDIQKVNSIIASIESNNDYLYNASHYKKDSFDFDRYNYIDISINGINYEMSIKNDEPTLNELKVLFKINKIDKMLENAIESIISMESANDE